MTACGFGEECPGEEDTRCKPDGLTGLGMHRQKPRGVVGTGTEERVGPGPNYTARAPGPGDTWAGSSESDRRGKRD